MRDRYPPHEELLLLCARTQMEEAAVVRAQQLMDRDLDWATLWEIARCHSVTPLVAHNLQRLNGKGQIPLPVLNRFTRAYRHNALRHALRAETLAGMFEALHVAEIPVIVLKGTALCATVYPDPALRVSGDVDLLVQPEDLPSACAILAGIEHSFMVELAADHYDFWVDLPGKWAVRRPEWAEMWSRAVPIEVAGAQALTLASTDLMLSLVVNLVRRGFRPLKLLVDVAETARYYGDAISWETVRNGAGQSGLDRLAWHAFGLAQRLLDAPVPAELCSPPADLSLSRLEAGLLAFHREHVLAPVPLRSFLTLTTGGPAHRVRALRERLLPSRRWLAAAYGCPRDARQLPFYYLRWPVDLLRQYGPVLWGLLVSRMRDLRYGAG